MRKDFSKIIGELGLQITAQSNLKIVNYLDVTLNLSTGKFCPYRKPGNYPLYINAKSNHPPSIIKRLLATISTRISSLSCDADEFNKASRVYNDALKTSDYRECLQYARNNNQTSHRCRNRPRNIIWFNPPYSENVQTNIASSFVRLIDKHFPKSHVLHKIFNRSNVKVSFSCTGNMSSIIKSHNAKILTIATHAPSLNHATAETRTFALLTVHALSTTSSTKQLSLPHPAKQRFILAWQSTASKLDTTTTSSLSSIVSIRTTLSYQSTSGTKETKTPISRSSGQLSREQALTGETRRAAICV